MAAIALGAALDRHGAATADTARDYYQAVAELVAVPWQFAVGGDFAHPETTGPRPPSNRLTNWYVKRLTIAAQTRPQLTRAFSEVQQLLAPPKVLFRPSAIAASLLHGGRKS